MVWFMMNIKLHLLMYHLTNYYFSDLDSGSLSVIPPAMSIKLGWGGGIKGSYGNPSWFAPLSPEVRKPSLKRFKRWKVGLIKREEIAT